MDSRPAPPSQPPPAYGMIRRVTFRKSLRGPVLFCISCSFLWSLIIGAEYLRDREVDGVTSKLKTIWLAQGILYLTLAALEVFAFYSVWIQKIHAGKIYVFITIFEGIVVTVAETMRIAIHFIYKSDVLTTCQNITNDGTSDITWGTDVAQDVTDYCENQWKNGIWKDIAWVVFGVICSVLMYILARAYYHQLLDPNYSRTAAGVLPVTGAASDRYRMDAMNHGVPYSATHDPAFVPPYAGESGQLNSQAGYAPPPTYDAPAYTPPEKGGKSFGEDRKGGSDEERDIEGSATSPGYELGRSESEVTLPGRQGEGRV